MNTQQTPANRKKEPLADLSAPFENIALAFSGGGFRAASFALGTMSYLEQLKLKDKNESMLHQVTYLSSASGGTIATALYALYNAQGKDFGAFYKTLFSELDGDRLLTRVLRILSDKKAWDKRPHKRRNLINAFALAYDEILFEQKHLGALTGSEHTHLEEVCFNTTEFYRGLLFRQAVKMKPDKEEKGFSYGNFIINLEESTANKLKIADLLAASSCFPAGFEPIIFPDDFENASCNSQELLDNLCIEPQELSKEELELLYGKEQLKKVLQNIPQPIDPTVLATEVKKLKLQKNFRSGFMDGGITDNQGLESMMRANERRTGDGTNFKPFDLMLVNDVGSHFMNPYQLPSKVKNTGASIRTVMIIAILVAVLGIAMITYDVRCSDLSMLPKICGMIGGVLTLAGVAVLGGLFAVRRSVTRKSKDGGLNLDKTLSPEITDMLLHYFFTTPVNVIMRMMKERVSSVLTLNNDVFLKRIRQLLYQRFFDLQNGTFRVKSNHVYDLSFTNDTNRLSNDARSMDAALYNQRLAPSRVMQLVAESAFTMGTTLWFDSKSREDYKQVNLVACGQFTTCYNLLLYVSRLEKSDVFKKLSPAYQDRVTQVRTDLETDYNKFRNDPFWLYNQSGKDYLGKDFKPHTLTDLQLPDNFKGLR